MTYEELAGMLDCTVAVAQERARVEQLDRKISRDGQKRAKLNASLVAVFIARIKTMDLDIDHAVEELRHVHGLLEQADRPRRPCIMAWLAQGGLAFVLDVAGGTASQAPLCSKSLVRHRGV